MSAPLRIAHFPHVLEDYVPEDFPRPIKLPLGLPLNSSVENLPTIEKLLGAVTSRSFDLILVNRPALSGSSLDEIIDVLERCPDCPVLGVYGFDTRPTPTLDPEMPVNLIERIVDSAWMNEMADRAFKQRRWIRHHDELTSRVEAAHREVALKNQQIASREERLARLDKHVFDFFTLSQLGKTLSAIKSLEDLSRTFLTMVQEIHDSACCGLLLYDDYSKTFFLQDAVGLRFEDFEGESFSLESGTFSQLLKAGDPFPAVDSAGNYRFSIIITKLGLDRLKPHVWVPIKVRTQLIGILVIGSKPDGMAYHAEEMSFIAQMTTQAGVALETARINIQKERATRDLQKKMESLSILYSVSKAMNFMNDLRRVLRLILDKAVDAVGAEKASLMLIDEDTGELVVKAVRGIPSDIEEKINSGEVECQRIPYGEGIAGRVAATRSHILVDSVKGSNHFLGADQSFVDNILCVPLLSGDSCLGVINVTNKKSGEKFNEDDVNIMLTLAGQAAVTINNAKLYYLAITDGMTQLHIRRYFQQRLKEEVSRAKRFKHPLSVIIFDLDRFKLINDTHGHEAGDVVLVSVARIIKTQLRDVDMAARYGGEEFAIICPETTAEDGRVVAERLRNVIQSNRVPFGDVQLSISASFGIATCPDLVEDPDDLVRLADMALYRAKDKGRNRVEIATLADVPRLEAQRVESPDRASGTESPISGFEHASFDPDSPASLRGPEGTELRDTSQTYSPDEGSDSIKTGDGIDGSGAPAILKPQRRSRLIPKLDTVLGLDSASEKSRPQAANASVSHESAPPESVASPEDGETAH